MYFTDQEMSERQRENLRILDQQLTQDRYSIKEIAELMPGVLHLNSLEDASIQFVNNAGEEYIGLPYKEMIRQGKRHLIEYYHPTTIEVIIPQVIEFGKENDENKIMGYSQLVRRGNDGNYERFIGFAKVSRKLNSFICIENPVTVFGDLSEKMSVLLDDNEFLRANYKKFASLTKREIEILQLIGHGQTRSDISEQLNISKHTFDNHRKHIREKLNIKTAAELFQYIRAFDLF